MFFGFQRVTNFSYRSSCSFSSIQLILPSLICRCGHCKKLAPELDKAAAALAGKTPGVKIAKLDATVEKMQGTRFQIKGFPTLKFWKDEGEPVDYDGPRNADGGWLGYIVQRGG